MAIHYQQVGIYGLVFILNGAFGVATVVFHAISDQKVDVAILQLARKKLSIGLRQSFRFVTR